MLLLGDSAILAKALFSTASARSLEDFFTGITDNKYVFLLVVNLLLLAVGIFLEPLPALYILAPSSRRWRRWSTTSTPSTSA